ncbi:MAG: ABC transporter ATP-binding protein [Candidatus Nanopelagicales bacterium]|jgi:ABC-2 type transport system ATP-binding protein|nr:ABC transporter ATP-binding protein [Candidatus Nanopelagicales bacterium]
MDAPVLEVKDLVRRFGDQTAVDRVNFRIDAGETYGLLGPNGAGKTTTISMIAGLLQPDAGSVAVLGQPLTTSRKSHIGLVPQDIALYPDLSARENLQFFGKLQNLGGDALRRRMDEVLEIVGLADRAKDRIDTYSGGMKRRANIAAGLLHEPDLLILDEPTVGVDPQSRNSILESVAALGGAGMAVLYTTHYMEEAERLCDRVGIIDAGVLVAEGTRDELVRALGEKTTVSFRVNAGPEALTAWRADLEAITGVTGVLDSPDGLAVVTAEGPSLIAAAVQAAEQRRVDVVGVDVTEPDLEAVFLHLTGKALRD